MIKIITCHHYRHDCAELFYLGVDRLQKKMYSIQVYAAITKGDEKSIEIAKRNGALIVETENKPLGKKWNSAYELASDNFGEAVVIIGEDNIISADLFWQFNFSSASSKVFGFNSCAMIDTATGNVKRWTYEDDQRLIGAGRMFEQPKPLIIGKPVRQIKVGDFVIPAGRETIIQSPSDNGRAFVKTREVYALWDNNLNSGLDRSSELTLALMGYQPIQFADDKIHVLDFKTASNIHPHSEFKNYPDYKEDWKWFLSVEEKEYIAEKWNL